MDDRAHEHFTVLERKELSAGQVHAALRLEGEEELKRSTAALFWSAVACGTTLGLSLIARGLLEHGIAETSWRPLVSSFGYAAGFIALELGRKELYTGNTLTALLPYFHEPRASTLTNVLRVWVVVLAGNLIGGALFAWAAATTPAFDPSLRGAFADLARHTVSYSFTTALVKGVFGGWLIAMMIWLMPAAHHARIWVIALVTWALAASELTHIAAGSVDAMFGIFSGAVSPGAYASRFFLPVLLGNTTGGVVFVACLNHLQVATDNS
jgi:formate/nitrite transporter FocA (FNT family)